MKLPPNPSILPTKITIFNLELIPKSVKNYKQKRRPTFWGVVKKSIPCSCEIISDLPHQKNQPTPREKFLQTKTLYLNQIIRKI